MMTPASAATAADVPAPPTDENTIQTRFGPVAFGEDRQISLPTGILGFGGFTEFGLAPIPDERLHPYWMLQCLTNTDLCFMLLPLSSGTPMIAESDRAEALASMAVEPENASLMFMVTVRSKDDEIEVSANIRAPIVIDHNRRLARQVVLSNSQYPIRQPL